METPAFFLFIKHFMFVSMKIILLLSLLSVTSLSFSQEIYPEKYSGCVSDIFSIEKDTIEAKLDIKRLLSAFKETTGSKTFNKIRGILSLQVIVDTFGTPCLISIENKTNIKSSKLQLKEILDKSRVWSKPNKKVSVLLVLKFADEGVSYRRIGHGCNGWGDLRE